LTPTQRPHALVEGVWGGGSEGPAPAPRRKGGGRVRTGELGRSVGVVADSGGCLRPPVVVRQPEGGVGAPACIERADLFGLGEVRDSILGSRRDGLGVVAPQQLALIGGGINARIDEGLATATVSFAPLATACSRALQCREEECRPHREEGKEPSGEHRGHDCALPSSRCLAFTVAGTG
jgi:hypothetical protein